MKEILTNEEKEYLSNFIKPFRSKIRYIIKVDDKRGEFLRFECTTSIEDFDLPFFEKNSMYKNMKLYEDYELEELGL